MFILLLLVGQVAAQSMTAATAAAVTTSLEISVDDLWDIAIGPVSIAETTTTVEATPVPASSLIPPPFLASYSWPTGRQIPETTINASWKFPRDFYLGVAGAAYQVEGAVKDEGRGPSVWDKLVRVPGYTAANETADIADNNYYLYKQDIARIAAMGINTYSFSISWTRLFPFGSGPINQAAIDHYNELIDFCLQYNVTPMATLYHWDTPLFLQEKYGGWLSGEIVDDFVAYAKTCFSEFGDRVKTWFTVNEPIVFCGQYPLPAQHFKNFSIPYQQQPYYCGRNVLLAHSQAYHLGKSIVGNDSLIAFKNNGGYKIPRTNSTEDAEAVQRALDFNEGWFADPVYLTGTYPDSLNEYVSTFLEPFTDEQKAVIKGSADLFAHDAYTSQFYYAPDDGIESCLNNASNPLYPGCYNTSFTYSDDDGGWLIGAAADPLSSWLYKATDWVPALLHYINATWSPPEGRILVSEFGFAEPYEVYKTGVPEILMDQIRSDYYRDYMEAILISLNDGLNVMGCLAWSFVDNLEWLSGYQIKFGMQRVDFDSPGRERSYKASFFQYVDVYNKYNATPIRPAIVATTLARVDRFVSVATMDEFLVDDPKSTFECTSIEDFKLQFGTLRETKVSDSKAEHITATFEFRPTAVFHVPENESDAAEPNPNADATPNDSPAPVTNGSGAATTTRDIRAHETLMNQPADDPALQKLVAKHIITSLGVVDGSTWTVRSISRMASGWTFQYLCKSSTQAWTRQNAKHNAKTLAGESSGKDGQDPVNLARPAFDCRGSISIAFAESNRKITVKLEHTPFHKTVAELAELFKPPPPPVPERPSKKRKAQVEVVVQEGGENGEAAAAATPKKKRKKNATANPEDPNAPATTTPKPKKPRPSKSKKKAEAAQAEGGPPDPLLNLSPSEAARRRDEANRKLRDAGIDPATLSTEQFDIFSNQSPDLQRESLAMLVKYGAERLRIVHPNKDSNDSAAPAAANSGASTPPDGSTEKKKSKKKAVNEDGTPKVKKTRGKCQACTAKKIQCSKAKPDCTECVEAGISCYYPPAQKRELKAKPTNVNGNDPAEEATVVEEPQPFQPEPEQVQAPEPVAEPEPTPDEEASDLGSPGFSGDHNPPPTNTTTAATTTSTNYPEVPVPVAHDMCQSTGTGLSYPQAMLDNMSNGVDYSTYSNQVTQQQQPSAAPSGMAYPQQQPQQCTDPAPVVQAPAPVESVQPAAPPPPAAAAAASTRAPRPPSSRSTRRSLPSASSHVHNGYAEAVNSDSGTTWQVANNTQPVTAAAPPATTTYSNPSPTRQQPRTRNAPTYDTTPQDEHRAAATLSQVALQKANPSPTARTVSPFQNPTQAARAKSRQGQRSQNRTTATASPFQQAPAQMTSVDTASIYTNPSSTTDNTYDRYSRYNAAATNTQNSQASSRVAYKPYPQQQQPTTTTTAINTTNTSTAYPNYDAYNSRSQASTSGLAAPVTQGMSMSSYTKTAAPSSTGWGNPTSASNRNTTGSSYGPTTASSTPQSFTVRPQATAQHTSKAHQQQQPFSTGSRRQQTRSQQPSFDSYSTAQSHHATSTQPQQQAQQDWYRFGSNHNSNFGSGGRGTYGHSGSNNNPSYSQHRSMNLTGNTYHNMNDQELYEMLRNNNPGH